MNLGRPCESVSVRAPPGAGCARLVQRSCVFLRTSNTNLVVSRLVQARHLENLPGAFRCQSGRAWPSTNTRPLAVDTLRVNPVQSFFGRTGRPFVVAETRRTNGIALGCTSRFRSAGRIDWMVRYYLQRDMKEHLARGGASGLGGPAGPWARLQPQDRSPQATGANVRSKTGAGQCRARASPPKQSVR